MDIASAPQVPAVAGRGMVRRAGLLVAGVALCGVVLGACGGSTTGPAAPGDPGGGSGRHLAIVAAENFWGSIVTQLGGSQVSVTSVVTDPNADPHDYQSSTRTARAFATARYVIVNGAGYDSWAQNLLSTDQGSDRTVLNVADLLGARQGDNPHFWYSPADVEKVADEITRQLSTIDSAGAGYYTRQRAAFETALTPYHDRISAIRQQFAGTRIAATETIVVYLAEALGLTVISPPDFMKAVAEGNDPPAETVTTFQQQIRSREATVLVYNRQTSTAVTTNLRQTAAGQGIPVVGFTETIQPQDTSFQVWMTAELTDLQNALNAGAPAR